MALTPQQIKELDIASGRIAGGVGSATDIKNVDYAKQNLGYAYKPITSTSAPAVAPTVSAPIIKTPASITPAIQSTPAKITPQQQMELDTAQKRVASGQASPTDVKNIEYATKKLGYTPTAMEVIDTAAKISDKQKMELDTAAKRIMEGTGTPTDVANVNYATSKGLYKENLADAGSMAETSAGTTTGSTTGTTATETTDYLKNLSTPSEADILDKVFSSPEFKLYQQKLENQGLSAQAKADAEKQYLEGKYASDKSALEQKLSTRGLAFSGIRATQVKALADSLAASQLGVDRELASKLLDMDNTLMDKVLDITSDVVKEASTGRKEFLDLLGDQGLTIDPITGQLVPTLAAQKEKRIDEQAEANLEISKANLELNKARTKSQIENAQKNIEIALDKLSLARKKAGGGLLSTGISTADKNKITAGLVASRGQDGYVSPDDYLLAKTDWVQGGGEPYDFDKTFANRRNPDNPNYSLSKKPVTVVGDLDFENIGE